MRKDKYKYFFYIHSVPCSVCSTKSSCTQSTQCNILLISGAEKLRLFFSVTELFDERNFTFEVLCFCSQEAILQFLFSVP